jgi:hypothetical protein
MVTPQRSELVDAASVKKILEDLTGNKYILKTRAELVHRDNIAWFLHLPLDAAGYIDHTYEADGKLIFESPILYEVHQDMEHSFSESRYVQLRKRLGDEVGNLHDRNVRQKYIKMIPRVVSFFDKVEEVISEVNRENATNLTVLNHGGTIRLRVEVKTPEAERDESIIKRSILAMKEALRSIVAWQNEQDSMEE